MSAQRIALIIGQEGDYLARLREALLEQGLRVEATDPRGASKDAVRDKGADLVFVDFEDPQVSGLEWVSAVSHDPEKLVYGLSTQPEAPDIASALRAGAWDLFDKANEPKHWVRTAVSVSGKRRPRRLEVEGRLVRSDPLASKSPYVHRAMQSIDRIAGERDAVLLVGEPGSGKSALAARYHQGGPRKDGPLVSVLRDSANAAEELFGSSEKVSAFAEAKGGVVYVESATSLGLDGQERLAKLIQGLNQAKSRGAQVSWPPMVIGLEVPLEAAVKDGRLHAGLYKELERSVVGVPSLRDRPEDMRDLISNAYQVLVTACNVRAQELREDVVNELSLRAWPGNLRELEDTLWEAAAINEAGELVLDFSRRDAEAAAEPVAALEAVQAPEPTPEEPATAGWSPLLDDEGNVQPYDVYEAQIFRFALKNTGGCVSRAAELLGVGRATMYRKMRAYSIEVPPVSERATQRSRRRARSNAGNR